MLKYKIISQVNPLHKNREKIYYPRLTGTEKVNLRYVCDDLSRKSTLSAADITGVVVALTQIIPHYLAQGKSVELGDLGIFSLAAEVKTEDAPQKVSFRNFKRLKIRFRPGKLLKLSPFSVDFKKTH
ncbi:MAG: HU family DNA-binding protein [Marinifilaceae bacterium]|jgi:predicted histone-like DNA-binding protein